jgi:hypothetical protein
MTRFNALYFVLGRRLAGAHTPKRRRNRAAILGAMTGDPMLAVIAGRRARAEFERDVLRGNATIDDEALKKAPKAFQDAVTARNNLAAAIATLEKAASPADAAAAAPAVVAAANAVFQPALARP